MLHQVFYLSQHRITSLSTTFPKLWPDASKTIGRRVRRRYCQNLQFWRTRLSRFFLFTVGIWRRCPAGARQQIHRVANWHREVRSSVLSEDRKGYADHSA